MSESLTLRSIYLGAGTLVRPTMNVLMAKEWIGTENLPRGGYILCANHISELDPVAVAHMVYNHGNLPHFLAKAELFHIPVLGSILSWMKQIPVERALGGSGSLAAAGQVLDAGGVILIYPEGTLTRDPDLWPMLGKTGAARLALKTGVPVLPAAQWGVHEVLPKGSALPRVRPRRTGRIRVGTPVELEDLRSAPLTRSTLDTATTRIMDAITDELTVLRGEPAPAGRWNPRAGHREATT